MCEGIRATLRLQRLLAFYFQKKLANEEKAVVKGDDLDPASATAAAAPQSARSSGDQEQKYVVPRANACQQLLVFRLLCLYSSPSLLYDYCCTAKYRLSCRGHSHITQALIGSV